MTGGSGNYKMSYEPLRHRQAINQSAAEYASRGSGLLSDWDWKLIVPLTIGLPFLFTYLVTWSQSTLTQHNKKDGKRAPIAPYWFPVVGHLLAFLWDLGALFTSVVNQFGTSAPIRLSLLTEELYIVAGAQNLNLIWRNSSWLTTKASHLIGLETILATPKSSLEFYKADNSGIGIHPLPHSNVLPEHRVWHLTHQPIIDALSGTRLKLFTNHLQTHMRKRILEGGIGDGWVEKADLYTFIYSELFHVQLELLCGSFFLAQNPTFVQDFRRFNHAMTNLKKGFPRWMIPRSWKARDICLTSVKKWHEALKTHDPNRLVDTGEVQNAEFGNEIMRSRQRIMANMKAMDTDTAASADLGMLWALNTNSTTATFWFLLELLRDPSLHPFVQTEIDEASNLPSPNSAIPEFDTTRLGESPLLQSMYAETLRLRVAVVVAYSPEFADFKFKEWILPKDKVIIISSQIAHMDKQSWNTGINNTHPVDTFWADRFLVFPDDPTSGPLKNKQMAVVDHISNEKKKEEKENEKSIPVTSPPDENKYKDATFSVKGLAGTWVPYAGGPGICPGRHFAKQIILLVSTMLFTSFEIELLVNEDWKPEADARYYGLGVLPPKGEIPFRIRRRRRIVGVKATR